MSAGDLIAVPAPVRRERLWLNQSTYAAWLFGIGLAWCGVALWAYNALHVGRDLEPALIISTVAGGMAAFVGGIMGLLGLRWGPAVSRMAADSRTLRWEHFPRAQWAHYVAGQWRSLRHLKWWIGGGALVFAGGVFLLAAFDEDGDGVTPMLFAFTGTIVVNGLLAAIGLDALRRIGHRRQQRDGGLVLIGATGGGGVYVSGEYWPFATLGQWVEGVSYADPDADWPYATLVFGFRVQTKHGSTTKAVRIPVPPGREADARALVQRLSPTTGT